MRFVLICFAVCLIVCVVPAETTSDSCDECSPLAEVSITNAGLEKLISISIDENLRTLDREVGKRAAFRPLVIDKSHCSVQTVSEAWSTRGKPDSCYGLPELDESGGIGSKTKLRPYRAEVSNFQLNKVDLQLAQPVKCHNFVCDFEIKANKLDLSADMQVTYTDKNEDFIPRTRVNLRSREEGDLRFSGQVAIQPETGKLNDLVFMNEEKSKISIAPSSLQVEMDFKKKFDSKEDEIRMRAQNFHRYVKVDKIDQAYLDNAYTHMRMRLEMDAEKEIQEKRKQEGKKELDWQTARKQAASQVDQMIASKYGSVAGFKQTLRDIKWPKPGDDQATYDFITNPPAELVIFDDVTRQMMMADIAAVGENNGFSNGGAFAFTLAATELANRAAADSFVTEEILKPAIEKEVLPVVQQQVNNELRNLREYWNQISKIPNLNMQNLKVLSDLEKKLSESKSDAEKQKLKAQIDQLKAKMESDWVSVDTEVAIDTNTRNGKLLKAQITKRNPACDSMPKKFSDDEDTDFDIRTDFGVNTLQEYFNRMAENKNLDICLDSNDPVNCSGGTKIRLQKPPKIGCENGEFTVDLDAEAADKILGIKVEANVGAKVKATVQNCSGSPCIQITDAKGRFKNVLLNTFFGNMLNRGISASLAKTGNIPIEVPYVKLKKHKTDSRTCSTKLDWDLQSPPGSRIP